MIKDDIRYDLIISDTGSVYIEVGEEILEEWKKENDELLVINTERNGGHYKWKSWAGDNRLIPVLVNRDIPDMMPTVLNSDPNDPSTYEGKFNIIDLGWPDTGASSPSRSTQGNPYGKIPNNKKGKAH